MADEEPAFGPVVDVDLDALVANYRLVAGLAQNAETAGVVKCDAYGLGARAVGGALASVGCRTFFVAYPEEGAALRRAVGAARIYVFNGAQPENVGVLLRHSLTPILNSLDQARLWATQGGGAAAALHVDTGINRLGAPAETLSDIAALGLNIDLVMSHLACSSDPQNAENKRQRQAFLAAADRFGDARRSLSASGGALLGPDYHFDLVRPGAALYGVSPFDAPEPRLVPVARLTAPILQIRDAPAGAAVGYSGTKILSRRSRLAAAALGYGDGLLRSASGRAVAMLRGRPAAIIGRISMDLVVLDATDIPDVAIGDRAEFFGPSVPIHAAAEAFGTIGYELLTGLGRRVARRYHAAATSAPATGAFDLALQGTIV